MTDLDLAHSPENLLTVDGDYLINRLNHPIRDTPHHYYRLNHEEIKHNDFLKNFALNPWASRFIVFENIRVENDDEIKVDMESSNQNAMIIFLNCELPNLRLADCKGIDWVFIKTLAKGIYFQRGERTAIALYSGTRFDAIDLHKCGFLEIKLTGNAMAGTISLNGSEGANLEIQSRDFKGLIKLEGGSSLEQANFSSSSKTASLSIGSKCRIHNLQVNSCSVIDNLLMLNGGAINFLHVQQYSMIRFLNLWEKARIDYLTVTECAVIQSMQASYNCIIDKIYATKSTIGTVKIMSGCEINEMRLNAYSHAGLLYIEDSKIGLLESEQGYGSLHLENATVSMIRMTGCILPRLQVTGTMRAEIYLTGGLVNLLSLDNAILSKDSVLSLSKLELRILQIEDSFIHGQFILRSIRVLPGELVWKDNAENLFRSTDGDNLIPAKIRQQKENTSLEKRTFLSSQEKQFNQELAGIQKKFERSKKPLLRISNSSLAKSEITGCDWQTVSFEYKDSKILDIFVAGTSLPKHNIQMAGGEQASTQTLLAQKIAVYNQLKRVYESQGDTIEAAWYQSKAMDKQEQLYQWEYKQSRLPWYKKIRTELAFDLFNFKLNKWSNNHGESWRVALKFIGFITLFIYTGYFASIHYREPFSLWGIGSFLGYYFSFLDITHKLNFMVEETALPPLARFFDFCGRLATGYGIYQLIAAFRKHGKKSA